MPDGAHEGLAPAPPRRHRPHSPKPPLLASATLPSRRRSERRCGFDRRLRKLLAKRSPCAYRKRGHRASRFRKFSALAQARGWPADSFSSPSGVDVIRPDSRQTGRRSLSALGRDARQRMRARIHHGDAFAAGRLTRGHRRPRSSTTVRILTTCTCKIAPARAWSFRISARDSAAMPNSSR